MVSFLGLALIVTAVVAGVVIAVLAGSLLLPRSGSRCERCGATIPVSADACTVCEAPFETGAEEDERPEDKAPTHVHVPTAEPDPDEGVINPGVPKGLVKGALVVMFLGIGIRVLGMLDPAGLDLGIPAAVTAALTVVGGLAMFFGFVVLDIA